MASLLDLSNWLQTLPNKMEPTEQELKTAADNQANRIKQRTERGISVEGSSFAPDKTGKTPLRDTGAMLDAISTEATQESSRIFFSDPKEELKAKFNNEGTVRIPQRHFFGVSEQDHSDILNEIGSSLIKRVKR